MSAPLVLARELRYAYPSAPEREVVSRVNLAVGRGDRLGIVGENGAGKSTLLGLLAGRLTPTRGEVIRRGTLAVVEQELDDDGVATIGDLLTSTLASAREASERLERLAQAGSLEGGDQRRLADAVERYEALAAWDTDRVLDEALTRFGAPRDPALPLAHLSVGERYRVRLACRLAQGSDLLLLDEPTNHLDASGLDHLTQRLRRWEGALVVVTHDRELLDDLATAILDLDPSVDGVPVRYGAGAGDGGTRAGRTFDYAAYRAAKDAALARWRARYRREQERLAQLFAERDRAYENLSDEWRPPKGSQKHRRGTRARQHVKNADRQHERLRTRAVDVPPPPPELTLPLLSSWPGGGPRSSVGACGGVGAGGPVAISFDGAQVPRRLERPGLSLDVRAGGRLLVVGPNGSGKSTLLGLLAKSVRDGLRLGVLAQEPDFGSRERATVAHLATSRVLAALRDGLVEESELVPLAATGLVDPDDLDRPVAELSVGRRRRLDLALALVAAPHVLVLDEPTNHLAVDTMDALTTWLNLTRACVVVATHDRRMRTDLASWRTLDLTGE